VTQTNVAIVCKHRGGALVATTATCEIRVWPALIFVGLISATGGSQLFAQSREPMERDVGRGLVYVLTTTEPAFAEPDANSAKVSTIKKIER
jgi:hypothetical protein